MPEWLDDLVLLAETKAYFDNKDLLEIAINYEFDRTKLEKKLDKG